MTAWLRKRPSVQRDAVVAFVTLIIGVIAYVVNAGFVLPEWPGIVFTILVVWAGIGGLYCVGTRRSLYRVPIVVSKHGNTFWLIAAFFGMAVPLSLLVALFIALRLGTVGTPLL